MINNDWDNLLMPIWESEGFKKFMNIIKKEYENKVCYPKYENIFNALKLTPYEKVKVVVIGQDPYHGENQAHGLSFSVQKGVPLPPSLQNIFKELNADLSIPVSESGDLSKWASEGVLLLNSILSVEANKPLSHSKLGWQIFTDHVIKLINQKNTPVVFVLWGSFARSKKSLITNPIHYVIESVHPSPLSAYNGFFGSKPFSKINSFLRKNNIKEIDFTL